ncbi:putative bifunctional diguanylate cyclase/phosphodiesterase [Mesorhizobium koreense]|uniref:putative bifunctional diguanylate cyclase/phosphodiesterase n=1 Tax=Mesorhizobium koreense TaxID=3074855 RepID=UPI00287BA920|nr:GGDEF and EAL domain-containing protein [Mesorhizobium sp. WR6]
MHLSKDIARKVFKATARSRWKPADPTLWALLMRKYADRNRTILRWGMAAAVLSYIGYGLFDWLLFPDIAGRLILTRLTLGLGFLTLIEVCARRGAELATLHLIAASAIVAGAVGWLAFAIGTSHQSELSYFMVFGTVFILGANLFFNFRLWLSIASSVVVTVAFIAAALFSLNADIVGRAIVSVYFANCFILSLYLSWRLSLERYQEFLHTLRAQVQERAALEKGEKLGEIANTDPLTGLRNRRAIAREFSELSKQWAAGGRDIGDDAIGVLLIDVDHFKAFNDRLGHQAGDDCLMMLADAFAETASRHKAIAGRYGGEEFVVLCRIEGESKLRVVAEEFCRAVENLRISHPNRSDGHDIVTISVGATLTRADKSMELRVLLQEADRALYASKFAGRATLSIYDPAATDQERSDENLSRLLKVAVDRGLVSVAYQPIYDIVSEQVLGHEALMRLRDQDGSDISPEVFIPAAEQNGSIVELGTWLIDQACKDMVEHELGSLVTANVSVVQLRTPGFPLQITDILGRHGLSPQKLALEVTEGSDIFLEARAARNIEHLRSLGVQIWLDDFGTGFAGLAWLRRFKFDVVKIDRSFLHDSDTPRGAGLLQDMVRLLRNLGYAVLIEGVETEQQMMVLKQMDIHWIQGFLKGRPVPIEEVGQMMEGPFASRSVPKARAGVN